jgi:hypothetical protein
VNDCLQCDKGKYQTGSGLTDEGSCILCHAGTYQTGLGMSDANRCESCLPGTYQTGIGMISSQECVVCASNSYQTGIGMKSASNCIPCPYGKYQSGIGVTNYQACEDFLTTVPFVPNLNGTSLVGLSAAGIRQNTSSQITTFEITFAVSASKSFSFLRSTNDSQNVSTSLAVLQSFTIANRDTSPGLTSNQSAIPPPPEMRAAVPAWTITASVKVEGSIPIASMAEFVAQAAMIRSVLAASIMDAVVGSQEISSVSSSNYSIVIIKLCYDGQCIVFPNPADSLRRSSSSKSLTATFVLIAYIARGEMNHSDSQTEALATLASGSFGPALSESLAARTAASGLGSWTVNASTAFDSGSDGDTMPASPWPSQEDRGVNRSNASTEGISTASDKVPIQPSVLIVSTVGASVLALLCVALCQAKRLWQNGKVHDIALELDRWPPEKQQGSAVDLLRDDSKPSTAELEDGGHCETSPALILHWGASEPDCLDAVPAPSKDAGSTGSQAIGPADTRKRTRPRYSSLEPLPTSLPVSESLRLPPLAVVEPVATSVPSARRSEGAGGVPSRGSAAPSPTSAARDPALRAIAALDPSPEPASPPRPPPEKHVGLLPPLPPRRVAPVDWDSAQAAPAPFAPPPAATAAVRVRGLRPMLSLAHPPLSRAQPTARLRPSGAAVATERAPSDARAPGAQDHRPSDSRRPPSEQPPQASRDPQTAAARPAGPEPSGPTGPGASSAPLPGPPGAVASARGRAVPLRPLPLAPAMREVLGQGGESGGDATRMAAEGAERPPERPQAARVSRPGRRRPLPPLALPPLSVFRLAGGTAGRGLSGSVGGGRTLPGSVEDRRPDELRD